jgi:hypothetical protein
MVGVAGPRMPRLKIRRDKVMSADGSPWDQKCEGVRLENGELIEEFRVWLSAKRLTAKTVKRHIGNLDLFINHCLLYDEIIRPKDGWDKIGYFLG